MKDGDRFKLLNGPYSPPYRCGTGRRLFCEIRGWVMVHGFSDGRIPWPFTRIGAGGRGSLIVCGDLLRAVLRESNQSVAYWWGVAPGTVSAWRKALDVPPVNHGTLRLKREYFSEPWAKRAQRKAWSKARDPIRREKIAAARRGKPRPPHVREALAEANRGRKIPEGTRRKMSATHKRRGTRPPWIGPAWTAAEDSLLGKLPDKEVADFTGRTVVAVWTRRQRLRIPNLSGKGKRMRKRTKQPR
jgi:hypothetical protein